MKIYCKKCQDQGIVLSGKGAFKTVQPCKVCGNDTGYFEYVRQRYSSEMPSGIQCRHHENVIELNFQKIEQKMYIEAAENNGRLPHKSKGDNVLDFSSFKERKNGKDKKST